MAEKRDRGVRNHGRAGHGRAQSPGRRQGAHGHGGGRAGRLADKGPAGIAPAGDQGRSQRRRYRSPDRSGHEVGVSRNVQKHKEALLLHANVEETAADRGDDWERFLAGSGLSGASCQIAAACSEYLALPDDQAYLPAVTVRSPARYRRHKFCHSLPRPAGRLSRLLALSEPPHQGNSVAHSRSPSVIAFRYGRSAPPLASSIGSTEWTGSVIRCDLIIIGRIDCGAIDFAK